MHLEVSALWRRAQLPVQLGLGALPLLMAMDAHQPPARLWTAPMAVVVYLAAALACLLVPGKRRLLTAGVGAAVIVLADLLACGGQPLIADVVRCALMLVLLAATLPLAARSGRHESTPTVPMVCGACYLIVYASAELHLWDIVPEVRAAFDALLLASFLLFMLLTLLQAGENTLETAAAFGKVPEALRRRTRVLVVGLMLLVTVISAIPALKRWFDAFVAWATVQALRLIAWLGSFFSQGDGSGDGGGGGGMDMSGLGADNGPSALAVLLEKVAMAAALLLAVVLLAFFLRHVFRLLKKLVRRLMLLLNQYTAAASEDYVDEVASTLDDADHEHAARVRRSRRAGRRVDERTLTPAELVRWRYRQLRSRHSEWSDAMTARDTLPDEAAEAYERARYSTHEVAREDAERFAGIK